MIPFTCGALGPAAGDALSATLDATRAGDAPIFEFWPVGANHLNPAEGYHIYANGRVELPNNAAANVGVVLNRIPTVLSFLEARARRKP